MIIRASAPTRISLIGGGTDLPEFYQKHGGFVISLTINIRTHVKLYTDDDIYQYNSQFPNGCDPKLAYTILDKFGMGSFHHAVVRSTFDGIIGAGLGSSASFAVALIGALQRYKGVPIDLEVIRDASYKSERDLGWVGGLQDQTASAYGGFNEITFGERTKVTPIEIKGIIPYLFLSYIGGTRKSKIIQENFKELGRDQEEALIGIRNLAIEASQVYHDPILFAYTMDKAWELKKLSNKGVSNERVDAVYNLGKKHGAITGKILGSGGSGYFLFMVSPEKRRGLKEALMTSGIEEVDFQPDNQGLDCRIL